MNGRRKSTTPLLDGLAALRDQAVRARGQARDARLAHNRAVEDIERLREARIRALTAGDEKTAASLQAERDQAERTAADLSDRVEAAQRAVGLAEAEQGSYTAQNLPGLLLERSPDAQAAADAVEQAVADLARAKARWDAVQADAVSLLRTAGASTAGLPSFPNRLADLVRDARRADGIGCPPPIHIPTPSLTEAA